MTFKTWFDVVQLIGICAAVVFGLVQLWEAKVALRSSAQSNRIALRNNVSDLFARINEFALDLPCDAGEFTPEQRLHLMRLHYFYRVHGLILEKMLSAEEVAAEEEYARWCAGRPVFREVWNEARLHYCSSFRTWLDRTLSEPSAA